MRVGLVNVLQGPTMARPLVQVTVRQKNGQELQRLFETPASSSHVREQLQLLDGPGVLCLEGNNAVLSPNRPLEATERYIYIVSAGMCGPLLTSGRRARPHNPSCTGSLVLQRV